jgi:hypothetical protein
MTYKLVGAMGAIIDIYKVIAVSLIVIMLLAIVDLGASKMQLAEAFHSQWKDWDDDNFIERWYEEENNLYVQGIIALWGQSINGQINKCMNVLQKIGGSKNCDSIMLQQQRICNDHFNMFRQCNDGRLAEYLSYRGL